jgi:hypothetical protein
MTIEKKEFQNSKMGIDVFAPSFREFFAGYYRAFRNRWSFFGWAVKSPQWQNIVCL